MTTSNTNIDTTTLTDKILASLGRGICSGPEGMAYLSQQEQYVTAEQQQAQLPGRLKLQVRFMLTGRRKIWECDSYKC